MSRSHSRDQRRFVGDELYFTGYDLSDARRSSYRDQDYEEDYGYPDEEDYYDYERRRYETYLAAMRDREETLVQSAQERIRKAKAKGKKNPGLSLDEIEALDKRKMQVRDESPSDAKATGKGKASRSSSAVSLTNDKGRRKSSTRMFGLPSANSSRSRTPKSPKASRKASPDTPASAAPGFMIPGPDGAPMYAPFGYYPPSDVQRPGSGSSRPSSRPTSANKRQMTPPYGMPYPPYPPRYYPMPDDYRPPYMRRAPDELHLGRARASSSAHFSSDPYASRPGPAKQGRRNVSGPPDVSYTKLRRPAPSSPLAEHPPRSDSLPERGPRRQDSESESGDDDSPDRNRTPSSSESSEDDDDDDEGDEGVKVEVISNAKGDGYRIENAPVATSGGDRGSGGRRRRSRK